MGEWIPGPAGRLEASIHAPQEASAPWCVVTHPHPQFGGSMDNNVVMALAAGMREAGCGVVAFNFRGVGRSAGGFAGGEGECADLFAVAEFLTSARGCDQGRLLVAGYSFGAIVAGLAVARGLRPRGVLWVAPPLSAVPLPREAADWPGHKLVLSGGRDAFCPGSAVEHFCGMADPPVAHDLIPDADHFFFGHEAAVHEAAARFARRCTANVPCANEG